MSKEEKKVKKIKKKRTPVQKAIRVIAILLLIIVIILAGVLIAGWGYIQSLLGKMKKESIDITEIGIDEKADEELKGYRNIALFGIDTRADDYNDHGNRSDCIMIASINKETNDVKLLSVYRDSFLELNEDGKTKIDKVTHAFSYGGAQNSLLALNKNLGLNIKEYMTVNFDAVVAAVDALGGVEINVEKNEINYINMYIDSTPTTKGSKHVTSAGKQNLTGAQALSYGRIRYTAGADYKRTERMRNVLAAMVDKAKKIGVSKLLDIAAKVLPMVSTNIDQNEILGLVPTLAKLNISKSTGWPYTISGATINGVWYGVPTTLESNVLKLHKEIFEDEDYEVPEEIKNISNRIIEKSGKTESSGYETNNY